MSRGSGIAWRNGFVTILDDGRIKIIPHLGGAHKDNWRDGVGGNWPLPYCWRIRCLTILRKYGGISASAKLALISIPRIYFISRPIWLAFFQPHETPETLDASGSCQYARMLSWLASGTVRMSNGLGFAFTAPFTCQLPVSSIELFFDDAKK